ncbi:hypothetical protein BCR33DRAFT_743563 [Rhizoclosmatium globosum]|uniref:Hexosyltransferase n=1 Tax=Rhizoclosmatium globosum TaxID=329046 RepID=A0A1Y2BHY5_9FUNG|nr:hypothetical protein BCR33DRAFT_743563 [Rhizoclosmatium globosum]|eukprot:ORY34190.1 hypothetical protein BCR33DRAFT_743563 [Rhizoclosmatium globosum]
MGRTTQERLYSHGLGPSSALFPQDITKLLGQRLPKYDFIVQTSAPTVVNIKNLLAVLDSLNASQPLYAFHKGSNTAIMTSQFAQTVHISKELFNTLEGLQSYAKPEHIVTLDSNLFAPCNADFKKPTGFLENCNTINLKLEAFRKMDYMAKDAVSFSGSSVNKLITAPPSKQRKLLYGIFTYYSDSTTQRRNLMRFVYNKLLIAAERGVDVRFIFGIPKTEAEKRLILEEQKQFGDIIVIDAPEAMNEGKSFYYIQQTVGMMDNGTLPSYQFIAKGDDDMLLNLRGVMDKLAEYDPNEIVYFGRSHPTKFENFGMTYGFSIILARKIAAETPDEASLRSYEDAVMAVLVIKVANNTKTTWNFIDDRPQYGGWAIPVTKKFWEFII